MTQNRQLRVFSKAKLSSSQIRQSQIRVERKAERSQMTAQERAVASQRISETVINSPWFRRATHIACYLSAGDEVSTWRIIERAQTMKKRIFAPVVQKNRILHFCELGPNGALQRNIFGLYEPKSKKRIDARALGVVITPVVAFDSDNQRIGMAGGFFDRTFSQLKFRQHYFRPKLIGVAFACQKVERIPSNPWDIRLFDVITELS